MARNTGKIFEAQFKASVPEYVLLYRLPDPSQAFGGSDRLRFSAKPPFDYLMWDSLKHRLYALELKTVGGKSISFERSREDKGTIHFHQLKGLSEWNRYDGITCGLVVEFREIEKTVFIEITEFYRLMESTRKKSFNYTDLAENNIQYYLIGQTKCRTRYKYDVDKFLKEGLYVSE